MSYKVVMTQPAQKDLFQIYAYIADTLKAPDSASRIYEAIRAEILSLREMPERYAVIDEPPYNSAGVRETMAENYIVFYMADHQSQTVTILRILYNRREWRHILSADLG